MKKFEIEWVEKVHRSISVEAKNKTDALNKFLVGDFNHNHVETTDASIITEEEELLAGINEITE